MNLSPVFCRPHILMLLDTRTAHYTLIGLFVTKSWSDLVRSDRVPRFISVDFLHKHKSDAVSHFFDYKCKIRGVVFIACTRALHRLPDGNLVYQITRSVPIAVIVYYRNEHHGDMRTHVHYRPKKAVGGLRRWLHINNARVMSWYFHLPSLFWGCGYHNSHAASTTPSQCVGCQ